jgi:uncharacterized protein with PQ loop repeat
MGVVIETFIMNDFQNINDVVAESVRNSSYLTVVISSCVFIIYTLIVQLISYFKSKSKEKPLIEMANAIKENTANIVKLNSVLDKTLKEADRKQQKHCEATIDTGFKAFGFKIIQIVSGIIAHNNIDKNRELIIGNITKLISTEYYNLYSKLSAYEINEINVASKLKEEWIKEVADNIIAIVYDEQDAITRITQLTNRINIYVNEYSTYINNKIFNT